MANKIALYTDTYVVVGSIEIDSVLSRNMKAQTFPFIVQRFEVIESLDVVGLCIFNWNS